MGILDFRSASTLLTACTGVNYPPDYLEKILADGVKRDFEINCKFNLKKEADTLPERFLKEPLKEGPTKGSTVDIEKMVKEYYRLHDLE